MKQFTIALLSVLLVGLGFFVYISYFLPLSLPPLASSTILKDIRNEEIGEIIADESIRHREIGFSDIPEFYIKSLVWLEDRSFWQNNGLSIRGILRSTVRNIEAGKVIEGGSTLSAQYIRNTLWINEKRDLKHKILESLYAIRLNHIQSKEEILTGYINRIGFGYLNYGLRSASMYYFGKEPRNLTQAEQVALLAIPKNPSKYDPYKKYDAFRTRFESLVSTLESGGILSADKAEVIRSEKLIFKQDHKPKLPFVVDFLESTDPSKISESTLTTIDISLTERIESLARSVLDELLWRNVSDFGILIAEKTPDGPVLRVMIGGKDYHESVEGQVNTTLSLRQPGSTLKPFTYLLAFQNLGFTPETTITDLPVQYKTAEGYSYEPKNYTQDYKGEVTLRESLSQSINIPAIKLLEKVGTETLLGFLRSVGITSLDKSSDHYGLALTLGDGEVILYELLESYSIFAYDGLYCEISYLIDDRSPCLRKVDKKYTDMVTSIISDRYAKLPGFPVNSSLDFSDRWVALKTGTSRNFRDNWTIGFTDHYMIGVWTGNKNGENMKGVSGASGAGEIFARIIYALESQEFTPVPLIKKEVSQEFLEITKPLDGSIYERDTGKPNELQKIRLGFDTNKIYDRAYWIVDGVESQETSIVIVAGNHIMEILLEKNGKVIGKEVSRFEVRDNE